MRQYHYSSAELETELTGEELTFSLPVVVICLLLACCDRFDILCFDLRFDLDAVRTHQAFLIGIFAVFLQIRGTSAPKAGLSFPLYHFDLRFFLFLRSDPQNTWQPFRQGLCLLLR